MRRLRYAFFGATLVAAACVSGASPSGASLPSSGLLPFGCANPVGHLVSQLLPAAIGSPSGMTCFGSVRLGAGFLSPNASSGPVGLAPKDIQRAYGVTGLSGHGRTVAIVDAFDNPKAEADLAVYRKAYGLPPCTTQNGCFRKVNQNGKRSPLPAPDYGWAEEISLDLDAVSAVCPSCHILLVEANQPTVRPLMTAVQTAVRLGAIVVSNSYGGREDRSIRKWDPQLRHPGVTLTFSSGDDGYGVQWPASSPNVTAVGGTTLTATSNPRGWKETAWAGAGSGCSRFEPKPVWQQDAGCGMRTVADVSAVADPMTGLGVYDTFNNCTLALLCNGMISAGLAKGLNGWAQVGGTSLSAPVIAAIYALAGNHRKARYLYERRDALNDVVAGSNGSCARTYLCTAVKGYDGPTGFGTPDGLGAF